MVRKNQRPSLAGIKARENKLGVPEELQTFSAIRPRAQTGVVISHGYTASPPVVRRFADFCYAQGQSVICPRLAGHGTNVDDFEKSTWQEWMASFEEAYHILSARCKNVFFIGHSLGGLIAMCLAAKNPVSGVVSLAAPFFFKDKRAYLAPILKYFIKPSPQEIPEYREDFYYHERGPHSVIHLKRLSDHTRQCLPRMTAPVFFVQGYHDGATGGYSIGRMMELTPSRIRRVLWLNNTDHEIPFCPDKDFDTLTGELKVFFAKCLDA